MKVERRCVSESWQDEQATETPALSNFGLPPDEVEEIKRREAEVIPMGRRAVPEEVARWIVRLARPDEDWMTSQVITVDGRLNLT